MEAIRIDHMARRAAGGMTRRGSVLALGGGTLAALAAVPEAEAGRKQGRKCRRKARKKARRICRRQIAQCEASFREANPPDLDERLPCCALLANCDYEEFFACLPNT